MYVMLMSREICCSKVKRACGVFVIPCTSGSILILVMPNSLESRFETGDTAAPKTELAPDCSVLVSFEAGERLVLPAASGARPTVSSAMMSLGCSGGSERYVIFSLVERARYRDIDSDPARLRLQIQIEHGFDLYGVEEADLAAIDAIASAEHPDIALIGGKASEQNRMVRSAAQLQVDLGLHIAAQGSAELHIRCALDGYIEMQAVQKTAIARRSGGRVAKRREQRSRRRCSR